MSCTCVCVCSQSSLSVNNTHHHFHQRYTLVCISGLTRQTYNSDRIVRRVNAKVISRLVELLHISRESTEPGRYTKVYRSNRRSGLILDPNLCVDTELRDVALQCIYYIVDSSDEMKRLFCAESYCLDRVLNICNEDTHQGLSCAVATAIVACFSVRPLCVISIHFVNQQQQQQH